MGDIDHDSRCWRCGAPKSKHHPGPPDPPDPRKEGPFPCGADGFLPPPDDLEAAAWRLRRERDEYRREASALHRTLVDAHKLIDRALDEGAFS